MVIVYLSTKNLSYYWVFLVHDEFTRNLLKAYYKETSLCWVDIT